ncbi:MAG: hypothetical protein AAFV69_00055 [Pseudomonadota bacterium]
MIRTYGEDRSLIAWLRGQERIIGFWIEEVLGSTHSEAAFVEKLEHHRRWLSDRIEEISDIPDAA